MDSNYPMGIQTESERDSQQQQSWKEYEQNQTQVEEIQENKEDNNQESNETLVSPNSGLQAIPLPFIETSVGTEQNLFSEDKNTNPNEEEPSLSEQDSQQRALELSNIPVQDTDKTEVLAVDEKQDISGSDIPEVLQEKQTNVEMQDLDYWELEDEENSAVAPEHKTVIGNENVQDIAVSENIAEPQAPPMYASLEVEPTPVESDRKPEETEHKSLHEEQEREEVAGADSHQESQHKGESPMSSTAAVLNETSFPTVNAPPTETQVQLEDSLGNQDQIGSGVIQQGDTLQQDYTHELGHSEEYMSSPPLMKVDDKSDVVYLTEKQEHNSTESEWESSLQKTTEREQTPAGMEGVQTYTGNETSSMEVRNVGREGPFAGSLGENNPTEELKASSVGESSFGDTFESRARLHMLGDSQYKEKGWGHVKLQKQANHAASKLTFSVEPATNIFESKIDTDTKFQRVRAKSVRISGSKDQGKDDFVLQLPDTQVAEELVEFLTVAIDEQMKRESNSAIEKDVSKAQSVESQMLAQKQLEMERVRQHIAELEKRKALVRQSLQKRAKQSSQKTSPVATSMPQSPTVANLSHSQVSNSNNIPETSFVCNKDKLETALPQQDLVVQDKTREETVKDAVEAGGGQSTSQEHKPIESNERSPEQDAMQLVLPASQQAPEHIHSLQEQHVVSSPSDNQTLQEEKPKDRSKSQNEDGFSDVREHIRRLEEYVQEQLQSTKTSLSDYLKREELDSNLNKLMEMLTNEAESRIALLLSEMDGIIKLLDKNREENQSEAFTCCRPWSFSDFLMRLHTFRPTTWPAKPESIDAVECARRGWRNVGYNLLECEGKFVYFDENAANYSEQVEMVRKKITGKGYRFMSPWIGNPCPESFRQVPWSIISHTIERAVELRDLELSIHLDKSCIDLLEGELEMFWRPKVEDIIQFWELDDERKRDSFFLGIFGWTLEPLMKQLGTNCHENCLHCEYCDIRIVLDISTDTKFHAEKEHRSFCAFRRGGWRSCLDYVRQFLLTGGQEKMEQGNGSSNSRLKRLREESDEVPLDSTGNDACVELAT